MRGAERGADAARPVDARPVDDDLLKLRSAGYHLVLSVNWVTGVGVLARAPITSASAERELSSRIFSIRFRRFKNSSE